jgi:hypothetical protein
VATGRSDVDTARRARTVPPQGVSVSQWFRRRRQTGADGGRRWQITRSFRRPSMLVSANLLGNCGAPGRIRTCDTRFRKSCYVDL